MLFETPESSKFTDALAATTVLPEVTFSDGIVFVLLRIRTPMQFGGKTQLKRQIPFSAEVRRCFVSNSLKFAISHTDGSEKTFLLHAKTAYP